MREIERGFVALNKMLIGAMMAVMFLLVFTNVVTRYGFGFSINWAEEISRFIMIWCTFLAAGLALREGRHVAIDLLQDLVGERLRRLIRMVVFAGLLAFALGGLYFGVRFAMFGWNTETMVTQIPRGIPYLGIPIGMAFFAIHLLLFARRFLDRDWEGVDTGVDDLNGEGEAG